jgi:carbon storage regulator CsrA
MLSRYAGEKLHIGDVVLTVTAVEGSKVRLGIEAAPSVPVVRAELLRRGETAAQWCARRLAEQAAAAEGM